MRRRDGYKKFVRTIEGTLDLASVIHYPFDDTKIYTHSYRNYQFDLYNFSWVKDAFEWDSSPQGHEFWSKVYRGVGDTKKAKEILTSWREQGYL
jgi:hypothetical protein